VPDDSPGPVKGIPINSATWGQVIANLLAAGVTVESVDDGQFLRREVGDRPPHLYPLPKNFDPKSNIGNWVFHAVIRILSIDKHKYFQGWHDVF
jgi:hypothetical protein